ncbi:PRC-barrel domain-containing protein [Bacillus shivajii]|uniref:PRC-barrel domain-containing protein n=1 Tax=Bacillus shivajii TaxID=1983719 RepID=UPI001CFC20B4|nr:PRC-barrel domain-containing protein [Bacillus shivajii]UCZ54382.1 PRC-barrel domain-containing protein [Bacillus shivajii]
MRTSQKVKGAPVFLSDHNFQIGKVADLVLSEDKAQVLGYWVRTEQHWWSRNHFLPLERISYEKGREIYCKNGTMLTPLKRRKRFYDGSDHFFGKPLLEQDGAMIGIIEDVYFLPETGKIVGYELTEGLFTDITKGIKVFKTQIPLKRVNEAFMVRTET